MTEQYAVAWIDTRTDMRGHGQYTSFANARAWANEMNRKYPHIRHMVCNPTELQLFNQSNPENN